MNKPHSTQPGNGAETALLLSGGGARAAYQVGVLQAIGQLQAEHLGPDATSPFEIIVGTSAGAINAAMLAAHADHFGQAIQRLVDLWSQLEVPQVYHASTWQALQAGLRWLGLGLGGWLPNSSKRSRQPRSLLNNQPLCDLLGRELPLDRVPSLLDSGHLRALAVTTSSYSTGEHVTFFDGPIDMQDWTRDRRRAVRTPICIEHLMASAAIPFLFPAVRVKAEGQAAYYGDGSMRQVAPISPVIHLGARRVLVIGVGRELEPSDASAVEPPSYPSLAQVANHALSSIFLDTLTVDVERVQRINDMLDLIEPEHRPEVGLQHIELLTLTPSCRLDRIAARHTRLLPPAMRLLLNTLGMRGGKAGSRSSGLAAYLLFHADFTQELMALGRSDTLAQKDAICHFFGWNAPAPAG